MSEKCQSCFSIAEKEGTEDFIKCAHESYKSNDSAMHKIGTRFAGVDTKMQDIASELESLDLRAGNLELKAEDLTRRTVSNESSISVLQTDVRILSGDIEKLANRTNLLESKVEILQTELDSLKTRVSNLEKSFADLEKDTMRISVFDNGGIKQVQFENDKRLDTKEKTVAGAINELSNTKVEKNNTNWVNASESFGYKGLSYSANDLMVFLHAHAYKSGTNDDMKHGEIITILPPEYRPAKSIIFSATASYGVGGYQYSPGYLTVNADGTVIASWKVDTLARSITATCCFPRITG